MNNLDKPTPKAKEIGTEQNVSSDKNQEILSQTSVENTKNTRTSVEFKEISADSTESEDFSRPITESATKNVQFSAISKANILENSASKEAEPNPVSEFSAQTECQNSDNNCIILSTEEDNALFSRLFPGVKRENVEKDPVFKLFADGKSKSKSFCSIYGEYLSLVNKIREEITMRGVIAMKNKLSSPGSLSTEENPENTYFTREQVLKMSKEQIARNYDKIRESQQKW